MNSFQLFIVNCHYLALRSVSAELWGIEALDGGETCAETPLMLHEPVLLDGVGTTGQTVEVEVGCRILDGTVVTQSTTPTEA